MSFSPLDSELRSRPRRAGSIPRYATPQPYAQRLASPEQPDETAGGSDDTEHQSGPGHLEAAVL